MKHYLSCLAIAAVFAVVTPTVGQDNPSQPPASLQPDENRAQPPMQLQPAEPPTRIETQDFKQWIGLRVETLDGERVGKVANVLPATGSILEELHADIGGFLGIGETRVKLMPAQLTKQEDKVIVSLTKEEILKLPKI